MMHGMHGNFCVLLLLFITLANVKWFSGSSLPAAGDNWDRTVYTAAAEEESKEAAELCRGQTIRSAVGIRKHRGKLSTNYSEVLSHLQQPPGIII